MIPEDQIAKARRLLTAQRWIFAKTMPHDPHDYTLRKEWVSDDDFAWTVQFIRTYGIPEEYGGFWYTVLIDAGYKYWTMGAPISSTILINRKPVSDRFPVEKA